MLRWLRDLLRSNAADKTAPLPAAPPAQKAIEFLDKRPEEASLPTLELREYRTLVAHLPRPTEEQIRQFASYVAEAKSWYKHLPLFPPGEPFQFFVDPWAGLDRVLLEDGHVVYIRRTANTPQFHYTWMTTEDYRSRFSCLSFACAAGTELLLPLSCRLEDGRDISGFLANNPSRSAVNNSEERECRLPQEISDAATIRMTGVIHPAASSPWVWLRRLENVDQPLSWPEETGGSDTARKIMARCQQVEARTRQSGSTETQGGLNAADEELVGLLAPERLRLQELMIQAMQRVVAILYGATV
jgi:hypothetical protein